MKKLILILSLSFFTISFVFAQAQIEFKEKVYDFGEVPEGSKITCKFELTNTGDEPLIITNARGAPTSYPRDPIAPGETHEFLVEINTKNRHGSYSRVINITSNAATQSKQITVKGTITR